MKTYILQKDLPDVKAGASFELGSSLDGYFLTSDKTGTKYNCYIYPKDFVENNTEWFKVVHDTNKIFTEEELLEAEEKAFHAGREIVVIPINDNRGKEKEIPIRGENYKTFLDYKNGISQGYIMENKIRDILFKKR